MRPFRPSWRAIPHLVHRHETKIRFAISGAINTVLGLGVFPALYLLLGPMKVHYIVVMMLTNVICIGFAFLFNKFFVFRTSGNYLRELKRFVMFHLSVIALGLLAVPALVEFFGITPIIAQPWFAITVMFSSYFWHRYITFDTPQRAETFAVSQRHASKP